MLEITGITTGIIVCLFVNLFQSRKQYTDTFSKEEKREKNTVQNKVNTFQYCFCSHSAFFVISTSGSAC